MRIALVDGVDKYLEPGIDLNGCVQDAKNIKSLIERRYHFDKIYFLINEEVTLVKLTNTISEIIKNINSGDEFFWYHSGHGTQVPDINNDENDLMDEALVLHDSNWDNMFTDDKVSELFKKFPLDAYCTFVFDTCFSGGMYRSSMKKIRFVNYPYIKKFNLNPTSRIKRIAYRMTGKSLLISACQEGQYSEEISFGGISEGVFTHMLINKINADGINQTCQSLFDSVGKSIEKSGFNQKPNIIGSKEMIDRNFLGTIVTDVIPKLKLFEKFMQWLAKLFLIK